MVGAVKREKVSRKSVGRKDEIRISGGGDVSAEGCKSRKVNVWQLRVRRGRDNK